MFSLQILRVLASGGFLFALANIVQGKNVVTCKMPSEPVAAGENISATFDFPFDVSQQRVSVVTVDLFPSNESDPSYSVRVFECLKFNADLSCSTKQSGYSVEGEVKNSLTLRITDVSPELSGSFICHVMSPEREIPESESCLLLVRDVRITTEPAKPAVAAELVGQESDRNGETFRAERTLKPSILTIGLPLWMSVIAFIVVAVLLLRRRWMSSINKQKSKGPTTDCPKRSLETESPAVDEVSRDEGCETVLMTGLPRSEDKEDERRLLETEAPAVDEVSCDEGYVTVLMTDLPRSKDKEDERLPMTITEHNKLTQQT